MEKLTKDITDIIITESKNINEKVKGLNFLELLKINIIQKLLPLLTQENTLLEQVVNYKKEIIQDLRNINISINSFDNLLTISKRRLDYDSLFLAFNEAIKFDIYKDQKNSTSIVVYKNTGISLPKDTLINSKYNKNLLLIEIINKDTEQILTK